MSESHSKQKPEETTILHLNKFASSHAVPPEPGEEGLTVFIKQAAAETAAESQPVGVSKDGAMPAKDLLGAVSYCYAKGVYESDRIERKMLNDPTLKEKLGEQVPTAQGIRRFRRLNREAIIRTLEKAFRLKRRKDKLDLLQPLAGPPVVAPRDVVAQESSETVYLSKQKAQQEVENAAIVDNMSKDG